ncbi:MAG: Neelaredoxin [Anaerolineaceae bacterium 4572_32.2]|nr:MAG: Neelaredoxin [Anaerolineaceae bacterium 4572_32.2]
MGFGDAIQAADWKKEKHAPVIECPDVAKAGEVFEVQVSVGKEIAHPNTAEHHINWISLYFQPEGDKFTYQVGHFEFTAHGEGTAFTTPSARASLKLDKPGTLRAMSLCNLHGLWESSKEIDLE